MTINEMLELGEPIFKQIDEAVAAKEYNKAWKLIYNSPQPIEWIKEMPSEATDGTYYHNDIELIEAVAERIFDEAGYEIIGQPTLTPTKTGVVITTTVKSIVGFDGEGCVHYSSGVASEFVANAKLIPLATPKSASMAYKNSMKKFGDIMGKSLNRGIENKPIEVVESKVGNEAAFPLIDEINSCDTVEKLATFKKNLPPSLMTAYMKKLKSLTQQIKP